jgi:hypothetical protein
MARVGRPRKLDRDNERPRMDCPTNERIAQAIKTIGPVGPSQSGVWVFHDESPLRAFLHRGWIVDEQYGAGVRYAYLYGRVIGTTKAKLGHVGTPLNRVDEFKELMEQTELFQYIKALVTLSRDHKSFVDRLCIDDAWPMAMVMQVGRSERIAIEGLNAMIGVVRDWRRKGQ